MSEMTINDQLAGFMNEEDENTMDGKFLTFRLGNELYGLPIENVIEIIGVQQISRVPDMGEYVKGVINLRGQVIPVIDVRIRFKIEPRAYDDRTCIMVTHLRGISIGLIVDSVDEVRDIEPSSIVSAPAVATTQSGTFIEGISHQKDNSVVIILNLNRFLYAEQIDEEEGEE